MLKFKSSRLSTLISSLDELKNTEKKLSQIKNKVFNNLHEWSIEETNNAAIQDVTNKLSKLYSNIESNLRQEKIESLNGLTELFIKFKEYDSQVDKLNQNTKNALKHEKKCLNDIKKCPPSKSIHDYDIKYQKAQQEVKYSQYKYEEFVKEIDATKSILFKTHFKRINQIFHRENESEKVILNAMNNLIEQIPDVSNEEVDDINKIQYTKQEETKKICNQANKKLTRLSSTRIKMEDSNKSSKTIQVYTNEVVLESVNHLNIENNQSENFLEKKNNLYPDLDNLKVINDNLTNQGFTDSTSLHSLPTYSDSESYYKDQKQTESGLYRLVKPTAPIHCPSPSSPPPPIVNYKTVSFNLEQNKGINSSVLMNNRYSSEFE